MKRETKYDYEQQLWGKLPQPDRSKTFPKQKKAPSQAIPMNVCCTDTKLPSQSPS